MSLPKFEVGAEPRKLNITDLERIVRFRRAGYGGSVSDSLNSVGVRDTVFSADFKPLRQGMQLVGRALPIKLHSLIEPRSEELQKDLEQEWEAKGGHPQKRMMRAVEDAQDGSILCFDCGEIGRAHV